jgi:hypothetical protein
VLPDDLRVITVGAHHAVGMVSADRPGRAPCRGLALRRFPDRSMCRFLKTCRTWLALRG